MVYPSLLSLLLCDLRDLELILEFVEASNLRVRHLLKRVTRSCTIIILLLAVNKETEGRERRLNKSTDEFYSHFINRSAVNSPTARAFTLRDW